MALKEFPVHATLAATDLARARTFYEEKLGFSPASVAPGGVFYHSAGGTRFLVYPSTHAGTNKATYAGWSVKDIEAEVKSLKAHGVTFETYDMPGFDRASSIATFGTLRSAWFKDTEGNILGVVQLPG
jgi:catechol 2,3-dioxygenase-like lactoylglutathione lyase family enzyme